MKLFKCSVCNFIYESEEALENCPMCGAPKDKHVALSDEVAAKTYKADYTNSLHNELVGLANTMIGICDEGIEDDLDPMCVKIFRASKQMAWEIKQKSKAEIENHVKKEKW